MKVICIHHRLGGYGSHHFNESLGLARELARRGRELVLLLRAAAPPRLVAELGARAVLDEDPTFRLEWSFAERSRRFLAMLHTHVDPLLERDDRVLLTIATQLEAHALTRWIERLPERRKPWIVIVFLSDRWNRSGPVERACQVAEFAALRAAIAALSPGNARRLVFTSVTPALARELSGLLGTHVEPVPIPLPYGERPPAAPRSGGPPRVAVLGGTRREKGSHLLPGIVRACRDRVDVRFLVQLANDNLTPEDVRALAAVVGEPGVTVLPDALPVADYEAALASADLALFPYEVVPYRQRTSGVFGEAVAYGKPVVVSPGTWMAAQIAGGRAAGVVAEGLEPVAFARAIGRCVEHLEPLRQAAQARSAAWRDTESLPAFLDRIEAEIATRARDEPRWRRWWPKWR